MGCPNYYRLGTFEARDVTRYMSGNMAQAWQYVFRCDGKGGPEDALEDLRKAVDFIEDWMVHVSPVPMRNHPHARPMPDDLLRDMPVWKGATLVDIRNADTGGSNYDAILAVESIRAEIARREGAAS